MSSVWCILRKADGQIKNRANIEAMFSELKDGRYKLESTKLNQRSLPQNAYLHAVLIPEFRKALNSVGYNEVKTNEQAKLIMKSMFLTRDMPNAEGGKPVHFVQDTHTLTKEEMSTLIDEVIQFCATEMNYQIPYPSEQLMMSYE